ncbi:hypothetical protein N3K66_006112 [Trichothecium roseum]|uniref:Uncharacterized protein n=1 Tax=Trichothecium roseum TaxID=47278 RepID=A0ACC0V0B3_9HYPO|nr:hypothetical protein N3K66_006112 [Trichothecium roseum]
MAVVRHYYQTPGHVIAAGIALSLLDIAVVSMRFASRIKSKQSLKADDWLLLPATILTVGVGVCLVVGVTKEAFGYREYPTSMENPSMEALAQMSMSIKLEWSISLILPIALGCTKASFIFFYRRLFAIKPSVNRFLWGMVVFIWCWTLAFFLATLLCCKVMTVAIWKPISEMAQCKFFLEILMGFCITGFVTDLVIIAIPIPLIMSLKLGTPQKIITCVSFFLGTVTVACALARLIVSVEFVKQAGDPENDHILNITLYVYWAMVEASIGVFAACLPTLQALLRRWAGWEILSSRVRSMLSSNNEETSSGFDPASKPSIGSRGLRPIDVEAVNGAGKPRKGSLPDEDQRSENNSYSASQV